MLQIDIQSTVLTTAIITGIAAVIALILGVRRLIKSQNVPFYKKRHDRILQGWRLIFLAVFLAPLAWIILNHSEPVIYRYFSPSPTATLTPTITITPSITLTPTTTLTPTITDTPSITSTPSIPGEIVDDFEGEVTPSPDAVFSLILFSQRIDDALQPINPATEFENPVRQVFGTFSYNNMSDGVQYTALWYRNGELVFFESNPWHSGSGGYGYTTWDPGSDQWLPGTYEVQIFVGTAWKTSGFFSVTGVAPTPTATPTPTQSFTPSRTPTRTSTVTPSQTLWPTQTITITITPTATRTPRPTATN